MSAASQIEGAVAHEGDPLHGNLRRRAHMAARPPMSAILAVNGPRLDFGTTCASAASMILDAYDSVRDNRSHLAARPSMSSAVGLYGLWHHLRYSRQA